MSVQTGVSEKSEVVDSAQGELAGNSSPDTGNVSPGLSTAPTPDVVPSSSQTSGGLVSGQKSFLGRNLKKAGFVLLVILLGLGAFWVWNKYFNVKPVPAQITEKTVNVAAGSGPISQDSVSGAVTGGTAVVSNTVSGAAGSHNALLLVGITGYMGAADNTITSATYSINGGSAQPLQLQESQATGACGGFISFPCRMRLAYYYKALGNLAANTSISVTVTPSLFSVIPAIYSNVNQTTPFVLQTSPAPPCDFITGICLGNYAQSLLKIPPVNINTKSGSAVVALAAAMPNDNQSITSFIGGPFDFVSLLGFANSFNSVSTHYAPSASSGWNSAPNITQVGCLGNFAPIGGWSVGCPGVHLAEALNPDPVDPPVPPATTVVGVPGCLASGSTYGSGLTLNWGASAGATGYTIRFTKDTKTNSNFATKTVGNVTSTSGAGSWSNGGNASVTWVSGGNLNLQPNVTYFYAVSAQISGGGDSGYDLVNKSLQVGPVPLCTPADPSGLTVVTSCSGSSPEVLFTFTDNSNNEDLFWLDVNGAAWTGPSAPSPWGVKTISRSAAEKSASGVSVPFVWSSTSTLDAGGDVDPVTVGNQITPDNGKTYYWRVKANNAFGDSSHIYPPGTSFTTLNCVPPTVTLTAAPNPVAYNTASTLTWTISGSPTSCTNTANMPAGNWSTMNNGNAGTGALIANKTYTLTCTNAGGSTPASVTVTVNPLTYDLKAEFVDTTWKYGVADTPFNPAVDQLQPNVTVKVDVKVTNFNASGTPSPLTDLYIYYQTGNPDVPICPDPPGHAATIVPGDAAGSINQGYSVLAINSTAATTASFRTIPVTFTIGTVGNAVTAYVGPRCDLNDPNWNGTNSNVDSQQYIVATVGFFETQGGDVGAAVGKSIRVAFDSSTIPAASGGPKYQSDYVIAAGNVDSSSNVHSRPPGWMLNNYSAKQVPTSGIYDYFAGRFPRPVPAASTCDFVSSKPVSYCNGNFTFTNTGPLAKTAPTWDSVIFVDDDLNIESDLILNPDVTLIFIVNGDITVSLGVKQIDGIFISKEGFTDSDVAASASGVASNGFLTVKGAVYTDADGGTLNLKRYFTGAFNTTTPSVKFIFEPKYLAKESVRSLIGVKSIKWTEVAP